MAAFLIDEDLPRSLARALRTSGLEAEDVRDVGLRGKTDDEVFEYAVSHSRTLLSADLSFGNLQRFPLGTHSGIVIARFPNEMSTALVTDAILSALKDLSDQEIGGNLVVIEPGRMRLRRKS
jgi:predicted nuclease of predicted toxin-antitoxin system